ncbi:MAG: 2-oxo acid dehydrogenase subunit E2 [Cyclobacteriaceae bacterium]|nr:2-oxo acid dehydrogenase subunit E2 [Cyclobacteriaceae bacterium]
MALEVKLPEISENIREATVVKILVSEGDDVSEDQPLIEIETDKALSELPSPVAGKVMEIKVKEGEEIEVGSLILTIEENGEGDKEKPEPEDKDKKEGDKEEGDQGDKTAKREEVAEKPEKDKQEEEKPEKDTKDSEEEEPEKDTKEEEKPEKDAKDSTEEEEEEPEKDTKEEEEPEEDEKEEEEPEKDTKEEEEPEENEKEEDEKEEEEEYATSKKEPAGKAGEEEKEKKSQVPASPSVRRFAREIGVDIYQVEGTGPGNRILIDDVKAFAKEKISGKKGPGTVGMGFPLPDFSKWGETERKPLSKVRQITAENTWKSWNASPHVTHFDKTDITQLETFRNQYSKTVEKAGGKLTITAILLKITGFALQKFPKFNSSIDMGAREIIHKKYFNVGVAVDTERGLLVPVVKNVDQKSLTALAIELGELAEKARNKKISPEELEGGNFVISNLGGIGGTNFTPVIFPPQVAILGVSRAETQPVFREGEFIPRMILPLNVSYDHKLIDGADGARFLRWICEALENPMSIFLNE